jgi:hypothetical protein
MLEPFFLTQPVAADAWYRLPPVKRGKSRHTSGLSQKSQRGILGGAILDQQGCFERGINWQVYLEKSVKQPAIKRRECHGRKCPGRKCHE